MYLTTIYQKPGLLTGNEAIALAAFNCGFRVASGYPGTPSTEIIETIKTINHGLQTKTINPLKGVNTIDAQWYSNEKVALEVAIGASLVGARSLCTMKHVGVNVAADPLFTLSYIGVQGGLVLVSADDPGMYSSQNEQDNRNYAKFAKIPMLEPVDSQECYDFMQMAIYLSETYDTPVLFRVTTRVCHTRTIVDIHKNNFPLPPPPKVHFRREEKHVMIPKHGRKRHIFVENRLEQLQNYEKNLKIEIPFTAYRQYPGKDENSIQLLLVTSGIAFQHVQECELGLPVLHLSFTYPLPVEEITDIIGQYKSVMVVEELDPFIEELIQTKCDYSGKIFKKPLPFHLGEYSKEKVLYLLQHFILNDSDFKQMLGDSWIYNFNQKFETILSSKNDNPYQIVSTDLMEKPPSLCSGCPHFTIFNLFRNMDLDVQGDIGCYSLAAIPPFNSLHSLVDMGSSIPMTIGAHKCLDYSDDKKMVAVIGDSTFFHSGITGIIDAVQNGYPGVICILDNSVTAMTGRQGHPGTDQLFSEKNVGKSTELTSQQLHQVDYVKLLEAIGVKHITVLDPFQFCKTQKQLEESVISDELHVLILKRECALLHKEPVGEKVQVVKSCVRCEACLNVGCPSISFSSELNRPVIDQNDCTGCGVCVAVCHYDSIKKTNLLKLSSEK